MRTAYALAFLLAITVVPASADLYSKRPINGTISAFNICGGQSVSDSFVRSSASRFSRYRRGLRRVDESRGLGDERAVAYWDGSGRDVESREAV
jgi:hypothetical protein